MKNVRDQFKRDALSPSTVRRRAGVALCCLIACALLGPVEAFAQDPDLPGALPHMVVVEAGALVIPMDNTNQAVIPPFNIRAYGLINKLLQNEIPVLWAISATKVKDGVDFSVTAERVLPGALVPAANKSFAGGPFIVTRDHAAQALAVATAYQTSFAAPPANVAVYRTTADANVDVRYDLRFKPYVGVGNVNTQIHSDILVAAGFPGSTTCSAYNAATCNWTMVDPLVVNNFSCLTSHTDPHREINETETKSPTVHELRTRIQTYLQSGGNFIAQCAAVRMFEGLYGQVAGGVGTYLTTKGIVDQDVGTAVTYLTPNSAFSQFVGNVAFDQGGSWQDGNLGTGGAWKNNGHIDLKDTGATQFMAASGKLQAGVIGSNIFYLGGHSYDVKDGKGGANIGDLNAARMFLNSLLVPPTRPPSCGFNFLTPGQATIIKDTEPDNPWADFNFVLSGPSGQFATLQDPGANECPGDSLCNDPANSAAWNHDDRALFSSLEPTTNSSQRYTWSETGLAVGSSGPIPLGDYTTTWECKNVPRPQDNPSCDPTSASFNYDLCPVLAATCALDGGWSDGFISGTGTQTLQFDICQSSHVICKFTNEGTQSPICLESVNAIGDLRVLGDVSSDQITFTTAAVSAPSGDSSDSIFLSSFTPIPDQSHWPGTVDHFVQPLPVVENADGNLVPDKSEVCEDDDDTGCLAWDAGAVLLTQSPNGVEVDADRRIGMATTERRVTYTQAAVGDAVPRPSRTFNYADGDVLADERDLWTGMGISFIEGETDSENIARLNARNVIRQTLKQRTVSVTDPDTGDTQSLTYVAGDFFHGSPIVLGGPSNFFYLANDLQGNGRACSDTANPNKGYRCFFEKERRRRKVLLAPSNDGQLHAFDAGFFDGEVDAQKLTGEFTLGTGKELFAHLPRPMLEHVREMVTEDHDFGLDGAIVADDFFIDPEHNGTPTEGDRRWRSVVIGGYRQGGRGLYALDLTHPDPVEPHNVLNFAGNPDVEYMPAASPADVPECSAVGNQPAGCDQPYPSMLWEFDDNCSVVLSSTGQNAILPCDDDANGVADLAFSWSKVNTGRVLVRPAGAAVDSPPVVKFVAIFGGGLDPDYPELSGNFLYMVDVETGKAIYKAPVVGAVPSEPGAVDTDQNGFLDTIYFGTTSGFLYKVNIGSAANIVASTGRINHTTQWTPFKIFDTDGRAIFYPPTVIYEANSGHYAVAFGTGDRSDLWATGASNAEGRFYLILDTGFNPLTEPILTGPLHETDFEMIAADTDGTDGNFLLAPVGTNRPGWVLALAEDERVVSDALAISNLLAFTTFNPEHPEVCVFGGNGKIYTLLATNANALAGAEADRGMSIEGFAGEPIVTPSGFTTQDGEGDTADPFETEEIQGVRDSLMDLFPADCRFGNFSLNISSSLSSREVVPLASIPVCIARKNWTEHF